MKKQGIVQVLKSKMTKRQAAALDALIKDLKNMHRREDRRLCKP